MTKCKHCWHCTSSYTNGLGSAGADNMLCCRCGHALRRKWHTEPDPKHGPHVPVSLKVFDAEAPATPEQP